MARSDNSVFFQAGHVTGAKSRAVGNGHSEDATCDLFKMLRGQMLSIENVLTLAASALQMEGCGASRPAVQEELQGLYSRLCIAADKTKRLANEASATRKMMS